MTSELEQKFYDTFGIEKQCVCPYFPEYKENGCEICIKYFQGKKDCNEKNQYKYPDITAEKLLEMICIYNNNVYENEKITPSNINTLKEDVLHWIINDFEGNEKFKYQIQQLFKEASE